MADTFSDRLRQALAEARMTQKQLADAAGVTEAAISHYLAGDRIPRSSVAAAIAKVLSCSVDELLGVEANEESIGYDKLCRILARKSGEYSDAQKNRLIMALLSQK